MQANYPKKLSTINWDTLKVEYPVRKFPSTNIPSETISRQWRSQPEIWSDVHQKKTAEDNTYNFDYNMTKELRRSQTTLDFGHKAPESKRFNKHTSCVDNEYVYPVSKRLAVQPPQYKAHGTTEMRSSYIPPSIASRLVTDKDQFKHQLSLPLEPSVEPSWHKDLEPLDTTHDGFEKHLDPYLTTSRLHHRPFTADQLNKQSASKDVITYYTLANVPWGYTKGHRVFFIAEFPRELRNYRRWNRGEQLVMYIEDTEETAKVRKSKPKEGDWWLPITRKPKSMYDREKFNQDFRETRTHNKLNWVPGTFRTEVRDNYIRPSTGICTQVKELDNNVRTYYQRSLANLPTNEKDEFATVQDKYKTEYYHIDKGKPLCSVIDQNTKGKNKRLEIKITHIG